MLADATSYSSSEDNLSALLHDESYRWLSEPRWYLWDGGFFVFGRGQGLVPEHSHHAIQVALSLDDALSVRGESGAWQNSTGLIVLPNVVHSFDANGALGAMLFVDPESHEGTWLRSHLTEDITLVPAARLSRPIAELRTFAEQPLASLEIGALIRLCTHALSPGAPPLGRMDPRVTTVLNHIQSSDDLRISLARAAAKAFLSPSRFAHLFKEQMRLPFSRYMLWRKLTRAMLAIASERTIADAAQAADFSDAAHLTRTFYQMVGMAPSVLMRGVFSEIPSPFSAFGEAAQGGSAGGRQV